jgi:hypothetical protein
VYEIESPAPSTRWQTLQSVLAQDAGRLDFAHGIQGNGVAGRRHQHDGTASSRPALSSAADMRAT